MKIAWVLDRATEERLAEVRRVAESGHEVLVVCADSNSDSTRADDLEVELLTREDRYPSHWQKSQSVVIAQGFREWLSNRKPDLVHVHGWRGLSRDLVHLAAGAGIPALVSIHDHQLTCLLEERRRPGEDASCERAFSAGTCLECAQSAGPATPWVPFEAQFMAFAERARDLARELKTARFVLVDSAELGDEVARYWSDFAVEPRVVSDPAAFGELYEQAVALGCEAGTAGTDEWYEERMRRFAEEEWDRKCAEFESSR